MIARLRCRHCVQGHDLKGDAGRRAEHLRELRGLFLAGRVGRDHGTKLAMAGLPMDFGRQGDQRGRFGSQDGPREEQGGKQKANQQVARTHGRIPRALKGTGRAGDSCG